MRSRPNDAALRSAEQIRFYGLNLRQTKMILLRLTIVR